MYLIVIHYKDNVTSSYEKKLGPFSNIQELDKAAHPYRNDSWTFCYIEKEHGALFPYSYTEAAKRSEQ